MTKDFLTFDKKIYDSVHGFIPFDEFEKELIDSFPFQRLHYVHQLGIAYLVYPGATHTRFEHSLGVMALATQMFDKICKTVRPDVFHFVPRKGSSDYLYWRRVLRMAALCHDLGHLPFSHTAEEDLLPGEGHEAWTLKIIDSSYLKPVWDKLRSAPSYHEDLVERNIVEDIKKIAVGEEKYKSSFSPWERVISQIITGEFFGADRIDYLLRDAKSTGVAYGLFDYHQLIETLQILPGTDKGVEALQLGIDENGLESCEALLLGRHFMHRRVYQVSSVKAYNFHLRRYMKEVLPAFKTVEEFLHLSDVDIISAIMKAARDPKQIGHEDAKCLFYRQHRFRAIALPNTVTEKSLSAFKKEKKIPERSLVFEFPNKEPLGESFNFPVSKRHIIIQNARECSHLLFKVPEERTNWVYVSPRYDLALVDFIESTGA
jgi:HD superfamily phosphohydrolase